MKQMPAYQLYYRGIAPSLNNKIFRGQLQIAHIYNLSLQQHKNYDRQTVSFADSCLPQTQSAIFRSAGVNLSVRGELYAVNGSKMSLHSLYMRRKTRKNTNYHHQHNITQIALKTAKEKLANVVLTSRFFQLEMAKIVLTSHFHIGLVPTSQLP